MKTGKGCGRWRTRGRVGARVRRVGAGEGKE
jgi:hypothetical protein